MKKLLLSLGAAALAIGASAQTFNQGDAFAYSIDETFNWDLTKADGESYSQYPAEAMKGQASLEYGFGYTSLWFNGKQFATSEDANAFCPVVEDPFGEGFVIKHWTDGWDGFGNFNFALPQTNEPSRVRVIFRVDVTGVENAWYSDQAQKPFHIKIMHNEDQDDCTEINIYNEEFWAEQGWRVADFVFNLDDEVYYLSMLMDAAGLSCQRRVNTYIKEVSVVPMSKLTGYTAPEGNQGVTVTSTLPELVTIGDAASVNVVEANAAVVKGGEGVVTVAGFNGDVELYNTCGQLVAKQAVNGDAQVAAPAGIVIVKVGGEVSKVVVR